MAIAIADEHLQLAAVAADFMKRHGDRESARLALESDADQLPAFWSDLRDVGWLGLHLPEDVRRVGLRVGGARGGHRAAGAFTGGRALCAVGDRRCGGRRRCCIARALGGAAAFAGGWIMVAGIALDSDLEVRDGWVHGSAAAVMSGGLATVYLLPAGDDVVVIDSGEAVVATVPKNLDPVAPLCPAGRERGERSRAARSPPVARRRGAPAVRGRGGGDRAVVRRAGERVRARPAPSSAASSARSRRSSTTAPTWPWPRSWPRRRSGTPPVPRRSAVTNSPMPQPLRRRWLSPAADQNAQLNIQVHGGIGFTWEHDAHLYLRRATALEAIVDVRGGRR